MIKITWLDINSSYSHSSAAFPFIQAQQKTHEEVYNWNVVKATLKSDIRDVVWQITEQKPDVIAYTSWLFTCDFLHQILSRVKVLLPDLIILGGGPEYLGDNHTFLKQHTYVDYLVRGEGEESFYQLLSYIFSKNQEECHIQGVCYSTPKGQYIDNGIAKIEKFVDLVLPEKSEFFNWDKPFVQLETTRGCFNSCAFCVSGNDKPLRFQSIELVSQRIETIHRQGIKEVRMLDRTFNSNPKRAIDMLLLFSQYTDMNFHLELHPALLTPEINSVIATLPKGVLHIEAGIQSLDDKVLEASGRKGEKKKALEGLSYLCSLDNVETHADLIAGLPYYTLSQIYKDVYTLADIGAGEIQLESLKLLPGTEMRKNATELGIRYSPLSPYEVLETNWTNAIELNEAMVLSRVLDIYYNHSVWHSFFKGMLTTKSDFSKEITQYFIAKDCYNQPLSQEKQGVLMFDFIQDKYPNSLVDFKVEWIKRGLSINKIPSKDLHTTSIKIDESIEVIWGTYNTNMRLYYFADVNNLHIFGFDRTIKHTEPMFYGMKKK